jgi:hypothetical protein
MEGITDSSRLFILLSLILLVSSAIPQEYELRPWEEKYQKLQIQSDTIFERLKGIHAILEWRAQREDPALLARLSIDPPKPRATGYGLLPEIQDNEPQVPVVPKQTFYSLKWLEGRLGEELENVDKLADQLPGATDLEPLVAGFELSLKVLRNLENNLTYHEQWQASVVRYTAYFRERNKLVALAREMNTLILNKESPEQIAELRQQLVQDVAPFRPTQGLDLLTVEGDEKVLPVTVCTDIEDQDFLQVFETSVHDAYSLSLAARAHRFSVDLNWRLVRAEVLYPDGPPDHGAMIDVETHRSLFSGCPLVLTTGASSTNALVGDRIVLDTSPVSRRTLAHEFGHLLGFSDAYIRGYDGEPDDPYGVVLVEWTGLTDDLMGSPGGGQVNEEMIEHLITAFGELPDQKQ